MNNSELTLDQLSEVAGGAPHYTDWGGTRFMSRAIVHPEFRTGYMTVSIALEVSKQED